MTRTQCRREQQALKYTRRHQKAAQALRSSKWTSTSHMAVSSLSRYVYLSIAELLELPRHPRVLTKSWQAIYPAVIIVLVALRR